MTETSRPKIGADRAVSVFRTVVDHRRLFSDDQQYIRMPDVFDILAEDIDPDFKFNIKLYSSPKGNGQGLKASVVAFDGRATLVVDRQLFQNASEGCLSSNFTLAHEFAHLVLGHHGKSATAMNFVTTDISGVKKRIAPNEMELETDYAAAFFLCGVALLDPDRQALELGRRACCDVYRVEKAQKICRLEPFRAKLDEVEKRIVRVVL